MSASQAAILVWIAEEKGFFRQEGLDVEVKRAESGLIALSEVLAGNADLSTTSEAGFVGSGIGNEELRILAVISASETSRLIGRSDRGIRQAADLAGKRIGVTMGSIGEFYLHRYLALHEMSPAAASLVNLSATDIADRLVSGDIDAGLTWEPYAYSAEKRLEGKAVTLPHQEGQIFYFMLVTTRSWVETNPEAARALLRALVQAERFANEHPFESKMLLGRKLEVSADYLEHTWPLHSLHVSLPQGLLFVLEQHAEWRIRKRLTNHKAVPNFLSSVAPEALREVRENSVGLVK